MLVFQFHLTQEERSKLVNSFISRDFRLVATVLKSFLYGAHQIDLLLYGQLLLAQVVVHVVEVLSLSLSCVHLSVQLYKPPLILS